EVAHRPELVCQILVEAQVDVDLLIQRAVERPHRCLREPTTGLNHPGEEVEGGLRVVAPELLLEDLRPDALRGPEYPRDELSGLVAVGGRGSRFATRSGRHDRPWIDAEDHGHDRQDDDTDPTACQLAAHPPAVPHVSARPSAADSHRILLVRSWIGVR